MADSILVVAIGIGVFLRFYLALVSPVNGDGAAHLFYAKAFGKGLIPLSALWEFTELYKFDQPGLFTKPPVFHLLSASLFWVGGLVGIEEYLLKFASPIAGTVTILVAYVLGSRISRRAALFSAFIACYLPIAMLMSVRPYLNMTFAGLFGLTILFLERYNRASHPLDSVLAGLFLGLTLLSKRQAIIILPLVGVYVYYFVKKNSLREIGSLAVPLLIGLTIGGSYYLRNVVLTGSLFPGIVTLKGTEQTGKNLVAFDPGGVFDAPRAFYNFWGVPSGNIEPIARFISQFGAYGETALYGWLIIILLLTAAGGYLTISYFWKKRDEGFSVRMGVWILLFGVLNVYLVLFLPNVQPKFRHLLPVVVPLSVVVGAELDNLSMRGLNSKRVVGAALILLLLLSMIPVPRAYILGQGWAEYSGGIQWIDDHTEPGDNIASHLSREVAYHTMTTVKNEGVYDKEELKNIILYGNVSYVLVLNGVYEYHGQNSVGGIDPEGLSDAIAELHREGKARKVYSDPNSRVYKPIK